MADSYTDLIFGYLAIWALIAFFVVRKSSMQTKIENEIEQATE